MFLPLPTRARAPLDACTPTKPLLAGATALPSWPPFSATLLCPAAPRRFLAGKQAEARGEKQKRPYLASECHDLNEADRWRQQILREIGKKVMDIQNAGLGEHRWGGRAGGRADGRAGRALRRRRRAPPAPEVPSPLSHVTESCSWGLGPC